MSLLTLNTEEYKKDLEVSQTFKKHSGTTIIDEDMSITWQGDKPSAWTVKTRVNNMKEEQRRSAVHLRLAKELLRRKRVAKVESLADGEVK